MTKREEEALERLLKKKEQEEADAKDHIKWVKAHRLEVLKVLGISNPKDEAYIHISKDEWKSYLANACIRSDASPDYN